MISLVIGLILLYIGSRLQLVLVELVATRQTWVGSGVAQGQLHNLALDRP